MEPRKVLHRNPGSAAAWVSPPLWQTLPGVHSASLVEEFRWRNFGMHVAVLGATGLIGSWSDDYHTMMFQSAFRHQLKPSAMEIKQLYFIKFERK